VRRAPSTWLLVLALAACGGTKEDEAKAAARSAKDKAASAYEHAKEAASAAKTKIGEMIDVSGEALDRLAQQSGILEELDAKLQKASAEVTDATTSAARSAAMTTLATLTKARTAIARRIEELKATGAYAPRSDPP
jgi:DNA repair exonuclease SbcCD ATPase subunit